MIAVNELLHEDVCKDWMEKLAAFGSTNRHCGSGSAGDLSNQSCESITTGKWQRCPLGGKQAQRPVMAVLGPIVQGPCRHLAMNVLRKLRRSPT